MEIVLIKDYKLHSKTLKKGTKVGVELTKGIKLINKGIAEDLSGKVKAVKKKSEKYVPLKNNAKKDK